MLIVMTRYGLNGEEKEIVINTDDILSIEPEADEAWITTSKSTFSISIELYNALLESKVIYRLGELQKEHKCSCGGNCKHE